ncbi:HAD-IB family phosphatase [Ruminococcus sp.]|uniref:HAD-IB family phosphatase n=1 Tax=Ruminococcus sp. TaxID=41978 RepID=UPI0025D19E4B|nr:HAD-IB family phosphatase [Ruminococcus sp.]
MNVYDFDKTIYYGDSTADFYLFCLKRHKKILTLAPSLLGAFLKFYVFKRGTKTEFKEKMYRFLTFCDTEKDVKDFWKEYIGNIKPFYLEQKEDDDVIISASPEFLLKPVCKRLKIKDLIASKVDMQSGKYSGINCHGKEKVKRFYEVFLTEKLITSIRTVTVIHRLQRLLTRPLWLTEIKLKVGYSSNDFYGADYCSVFLLSNLISDKQKEQRT